MTAAGPATIMQPRLMAIGAGAHAETVGALETVGVARPLIVTDPYMVESGVLARVTAPLDAAGVAWSAFPDTVPDPSVETVEAGAARLREGGFDGMIALGGGSPIDTAKAMGALATDGGAMRDYKVPARFDRSDFPLIAIPTTAGTGSEVTRFTVISDTATDEKMLCAGPGFVPAAALVDYTLTLTMPWRLTADTGIDTLTHAIEAYVSRRRNPYADAMARSCMALAAEHLRTACREPGNAQAREGMMLAATQGGLAFSNASVCLVHGMSRPLGAHFHVPHGLSNAMLLPAVTAFSAPAALSRYADCARVMGAADDEAGDRAAVAALIGALRALNDDLRVPSPKEYGIPESRYRDLMPEMAQQALESGSPGNNPRAPTADEIVALYDEAWDG